MGAVGDGGGNTALSSEKKQLKKSNIAAVLSGCTAGAFVGCLVQPLDVLRTRMQADTVKGVRRSTLATFTDVVKQHGYRGLWKGSQPTILRLSLGVGCHMAILETVKGILLARGAGNAETGKLDTMSAAFAGGLSRSVSALLLCPVTLVKTRMEYVGSDAVHQYRGVLHAMGTILKHEGPRGLFRGAVPTIASSAPFSALYYSIYTTMQRTLAPNGQTTFVTNLSSGFTAAVTAALLTQPADFLRTYMQLDTMQRASGVATAAGAAGGTGVAGAWRQLVGQHGVGALFGGAVPRMMKRPIQAALVWSIYEELFPRLVLLVSMQQPWSGRGGRCKAAEEQLQPAISASHRA